MARRKGEEAPVVLLEVADVETLPARLQALLARQVAHGMVADRGDHVAPPEQGIADVVGLRRQGRLAVDDALLGTLVEQVVQVAVDAGVGIQAADQRRQCPVLESPAAKALVHAARVVPDHARHGDAADHEMGVVRSTRSPCRRCRQARRRTVGLQDEALRLLPVEAPPAPVRPRHLAGHRGRLDGSAHLARGEEDVGVDDDAHVPATIRIGEERRTVHGRGAVEGPVGVLALVDGHVGEERPPARLAPRPEASRRPPSARRGTSRTVLIQMAAVCG